jgi:hypothetical protein
MIPSLPQEVDLGAIDAALRALWRSQSTSAGEAGVVRTSLCNWIFVTPPDANAAAGTVANVAPEFPCRVLAVETSPPGALGPPGATISAFCNLEAAGRRQICCEQITLRAPASELESLASTLLALLLPDLPTVLYWPHRPTLTGGLLARLGAALDRLIVDSAGFAAGEADLGRLSAWSTETLAVGDLAWGRLDPWRELLAALFDGPPLATRLAALRRCEIACEPGGRHAAFLTAGWLASRLDWHPVRRHGDTWHFDTGAGSLQLRLHANADRDPGAGVAPSLARLALDDGAGTTFVVEPDPHHPTLLAARIECAGTCPLPQRMPRVAAGGEREFLRALAGPAHNPAFEQALAAASALAQMPAASA